MHPVSLERYTSRYLSVRQNAECEAIAEDASAARVLGLALLTVPARMVLREACHG